MGTLSDVSKALECTVSNGKQRSMAISTACFPAVTGGSTLSCKRPSDRSEGLGGQNGSF